MDDNIIRLAALQESGEISPAAEESIALEFAARHAHELRYVAAWGRWLGYDGTRWAHDETLHAFDRARAICREAAADCDKRTTASTVASAKTVAAVERLAKADRRLAATASQWDTNGWLLNTGDDDN
jgi:putative DNA primase/helicase